VIGVISPLLVSRDTKPVRVAAISPPEQRNPIDPVASGIAQRARAVVWGVKRCTHLPSTSTQ